MFVMLSEAWAKFERYAIDKGYTERLLNAYVLSNQQGKLIKLISIRERGQKIVIWEDSLKYYEMDLTLL
ncbi:MAG TPA: hypothetical protein VK452_01480 [Dissulfurispiraceae bacterium]|nr:hypothetical protein [Dissulfurispiraceae bacterium]